MQKLTIGMAVHSDYDGVVFTTQSLRLYHHLSNVELIVVDNDPESPEGKATRELVEHKLKGKWTARYIPFTQVKGTSATRDLVFREASGDVVMCIDSHVLLAPGALYYLMDFYQKNPASMDLLQGPLIYDDFVGYSTHFQDIWQAEMWGVWGTDPRGEHPDNPPFEIPGQGLGLFACKKEAWLGFNPHFRAFGGEEMYIHEKYRQAGRKTWCLPGLRWWHRFGRPKGVNYPLSREFKVRNYILGHMELNLSMDRLQKHFVEEIKMPQETFNALVIEAQNLIKTVSSPSLSASEAKPEEKKKGCGCGSAPNPEAIEQFLQKEQEKNPEKVSVLKSFAQESSSILEIVDKRSDLHALLLIHKPSVVYSISPETHQAHQNKDFDVHGTKVRLLQDEEGLTKTFDIAVVEKEGPVKGLLDRIKTLILKRIIIRFTETVMESLIEWLQENMEWTVNHRDKEFIVLTKEESEKKPLPPLIKQAGNYVAAIAKRAITTDKSIEEAKFKARVTLCLLCSERNNENCSLCGCPVKEKASWATEKCPAGKW